MDPDVTFDPSASAAFLVGFSDYSGGDFRPLPAVEENLSALYGILRDKQLCGFTHVFRPRVQPSDRKTLDDFLKRSDKVKDVLFVYISGHGFLDKDGVYYIATRDTQADRADITGIPFDIVRRRIRESPAKRKILILDACFSGQALDGAMAPSTYDAFARSKVRATLDPFGAFWVTSSPSHRESYSFPGEKFTAFTGALIGVLEDGVDDADIAPLPMDAVLDAVEARLERDKARLGRDIPKPERAARGKGSEICIFWNRPKTDPLRVVMAQLGSIEERLSKIELDIPKISNPSGGLLDKPRPEPPVGRIFAHDILQRSFNLILSLLFSLGVPIVSFLYFDFVVRDASYFDRSVSDRNVILSLYYSGMALLFFAVIAAAVCDHWRTSDAAILPSNPVLLFGQPIIALFEYIGGGRGAVKPLIIALGLGVVLSGLVSVGMLVQIQVSGPSRHIVLP